ncbi:MAG TPA: hypothetical protein VFL86_12825, partial [Burkholderiaceae bacterium]|nr:hypothetical protein [Burkholderiaceae bacterium]
MTEPEIKPSSHTPRRSFVKRAIAASATLGAAGAGLLGGTDPRSGALGMHSAAAASDTALKMAFIQWQPHTVPAAWSKGIEEVLKEQQS